MLQQITRGENLNIKPRRGLGWITRTARSPACRQAVRRVLDRERKWRFRGTFKGRRTRAQEYQAARAKRCEQQEVPAREGAGGVVLEAASFFDTRPGAAIYLLLC